MGFLGVPILSKPLNTFFFIDDDAPSSLGGSTNQEIFWLGHDNDVEPFHEYFWRGQLGRCAGALETGFRDLGRSLHYVCAWPVSVFLGTCVLFLCSLLLQA